MCLLFSYEHKEKEYITLFFIQYLNFYAKNFEIPFLSLAPYALGVCGGKKSFYHTRKTVIWYDDGCGDRTKIINGDGRNFAYVEIHTYTQQKSWNAI